MKISLNWAQDYSNVDLKASPADELVKLATERLGGVEGVTDLSKHYDGIVVAKVVSCVKHPNADKLSLCKVDDGEVVQDVERDENGFVQVVCGAPNVREGLLVAWIPPAAVVPASYGEKELFVLEARDLRGELSNGMLASPAELGINDDHSGILEINENEIITGNSRHPEPVEGSDQISPQGRDDNKVKPGTPFKSLYGLDDTILEIENKMFTHRPDGFGQLGVARELAGIQGLQFESPDWYKNSNSVQGQASDAVKGLGVTIEAGDLCPRYMAAVLDNVEIKPSPIWLQSYLKRVGVRPINNVVDITNYMMMLTAQPLHAFDFDKVATDERVDITIRRPRDSEKLTLLDGKEIQPHKDATLICNPDGPIALGGVMGGGNSEVGENTTRIVLECATFNMYNIRKTSMIHGIFTDAVTRFNKGQPAAQLSPTLFKAVQLFEELAGANMVGDVVDVMSPDLVLANKPIDISVDFINQRLGSDLAADQIKTILKNVEFLVEGSDESLVVTAPFWRTDIEIAEDVVEEVGRMYGFNNLPLELPKKSIAPVQPDARLAIKKEVRHILSRGGANEVSTYSFVHGDLLKKVGQNPANSYALRNALSPDLQFYRQTLTPSLLDLVHSNIKAGFDEFALFEIGKSHNKVHGNGEDNLPAELNMIALTYASKNQRVPACYNARRYLDYLAESMGFELDYSRIEEDPEYPVTAPFDFTRSALVTIKNTDTFLGIIGEYKQSVVQGLKLPQAAAGFEIGLHALVESAAAHNSGSYKPLSKYPSTVKDLTLQVAQTTPFKQVEDALREHLGATKYQWSLHPLSIFHKNGEPTKNVSFRLTLSHVGHTLTTDEANELLNQLSWYAHEAVGAEQV